MTSQLPAFSVLRTKPRRCAHEVYATRSPRSWAMSAAMRFSKPSPRTFENGRLFGSAQTRRAGAVTARLFLTDHATPATATAPTMASTRARFIVSTLARLSDRARERQGKGRSDAHGVLDENLA